MPLVFFNPKLEFGKQMAGVAHGGFLGREMETAGAAMLVAARNAGKGDWVGAKMLRSICGGK